MVFLFKSHQRQHNKDKPFKCANCYRAYSDSASLQIHLSAHAIKNAKAYCCSMCGRAYTSVSFMKTIINCTLCNRCRHPYGSQQSCCIVFSTKLFSTSRRHTLWSTCLSTQWLNIWSITPPRTGQTLPPSLYGSLLSEPFSVVWLVRLPLSLIHFLWYQSSSIDLERSWKLCSVNV